MGACHSGKHPPDHQKGYKSSTTASSSGGAVIVEQPKVEMKIPTDKISPYTKYDDVNKYYTLGAHRGSGSFGIVREAIEKETGQKFAVKTVWKAQFTDKKKFILQEIEILLRIEHENIIKCYQVYEDHTCIHFVFDLIEGGDLFDYLISSPNHIIPENRAVEFFNQILDALLYLHENSIIHRDVKPENFLIYNTGSQIKLKLIDFGFAAILPEGQKLSDKVGSLQYIAPEMLQEDAYDNKIDMWAAGILLYNMFTGKQPFFGKTETELINNILTSEVNFNEKFKNSHAKSLCANLLIKNPVERFSASQAKASMWIQNYINISILPTIQGVKFQPKEENIKNILMMLNQQSDVKADVWNLLLTYLNIETINNLSKKLQETTQKIVVEDINVGSISGKDSVTYETLLKAIIDNFTVDAELNNKIQGKKFIKKINI